VAIRGFDDPRMLINMSVWESVEALFDFVYKTAHTRFMARRTEWFEQSGEAHQVLWWVEAGRVPSLEEGVARLTRIRAEGPTPEAFSFKARFDAPSSNPV
jgi:hypothetical protein